MLVPGSGTIVVLNIQLLFLRQKDSASAEMERDISCAICAHLQHKLQVRNSYHAQSFCSRHFSESQGLSFCSLNCSVGYLGSCSFVMQSNASFVVRRMMVPRAENGRSISS